MSFTRRRFVATTSLGIAGSVAGAEESPLERNLSVWVDTLLPGDEFFPSGTDLSVDVRILEKARQFNNYMALLTQGFSWTDEQARERNAPSFAELDESSRIELIRYSENAAEASGPRILFEILYRDAIDLFYSSEESWASIGFSHAPQPLGFPDYSQPFVRL